MLGPPLARMLIGRTAVRYRSQNHAAPSAIAAMKKAGPGPRNATASMEATKDPPTSTFASLSSSAAATFANSAHRTSATPRDENSPPAPSASAAAVQAM